MTRTHRECITFSLEPIRCVSIRQQVLQGVRFGYTPGWGRRAITKTRALVGSCSIALPEFNEPLRGSPSGLPTFSFLSEKCGVRAHFYNMIKYMSFQENPGGSADPDFSFRLKRRGIFS